MLFDDEDDVVGEEAAREMTFTCRLECLRGFVDVLSSLCLNLKKDHICHIEASRDAIKFMATGRSKSTHSSVSLQKESFEAYICDEDSVCLTLNLTTLLDCLLLFGTSSDNTTATMTYTSSNAIFSLSLEDSGVVTTCELNALFNDDADEMRGDLLSAFRDSAVESTVLVASEVLKEAIAELMDVGGAGSASVELKASGMKLSTMGSAENICEIDFPRDVFVSFKCEKPASWNYPLNSMQLGMKALGIAKETYIQVNKEGIMCIQHQVEKGGLATFVDFLMIAEEQGEEGDHYEEDEDEGGGDGGGDE